MKIGVLGCFYNCADFLEKVMEPWLAYKAQGGDMVMTGVHVQFEEYAELGFPDSDPETISILEKMRQHFDLLHMGNIPLKEKDARNAILPYLLSKKVDVIWLLDGDELYTLQDIKNIVHYMENTLQFDYYHVNFDNYIFGTIRWLDRFSPPRIIRTDRLGGIDTFTFDNDVLFKDGKTIYSVAPGIIPRRVAHVPHHPWTKKNYEKKIRYNQKHLGLCPFYVDEAGALQVDTTYFNYWKQPIPSFSDDGLTLSAKQPNFKVLYEVKNDLSDENLRLSIIRLLSALLAMERRNEVIIDLVITGNFDESTRDNISRMLSICPFAVRLVKEYNTDTADCFIVPDDIHTRDTDDLVQKMVSYTDHLRSNFL